MPEWTGGVFSATIGAFCFVLAWFFYKVLKKWEVAAPVFMLVGTMSLMGSQVGRLMQTGVSMADTALVAQIGKYTGAGLTGVFGLIFAFYFLVHVLKDRQVHKMTLVSAVLTPMTVASIPGPVGVALVGTFGILGTMTSSIVGAMFGVH